MMSEATRREAWRRINWLGLIAGALTLALPFWGPWWKFTLGTEAVTVFMSPFGVEMRFFGVETISSPLFWWLCLGIKLCFVYLGALLLVGSVLAVSERYAAIGAQFVRFCALKLLWFLAAFVAVLLVAIVLVNQLPGTFGLPLQLQLPYLIGRSTASAGLNGMRITIPVTMAFLQPFVIAVLAAAAGISARVYHDKVL